MRVGSLFSGYGGLDLAALEAFHGVVAWHCEYEPAPSAILEHHWPGVPNLHDVTEVDWTTVPTVDILTGGYPCQPFSAAGKRKGTNDERHLWPYVREAIRVLRPRYTVLENVAGHRSLGFDRVLGDLAEDGMHVRWTSLRASDIGAPHHRERLFILVTPADDHRVGRGQGTGQPCAGEAEEPANLGSIGPLSDPGNDGCEGCAQRDGVSAAGVPASRRDDADRRGDRASDTGRSTVRQQPRGASTEEAGPDAGDGPIDHRGERPPRVGREGSSEPEGIRCDRRRSTSGQAEGPHAAARGCSTGIDWGAYAPAVRRWERLTRPAPEPTEPNRNGRPRLSAAFAEWMMGLPAGYVTAVPGISRADQLKAIGNGVCPQQAVAALNHLLAMKEATVA
ncbi:DNA cytosine methyltransferase [Prescottella equi]|uniref:DNA cytosine methyltransferase n=1 Tax=Rhodococcus hoagii TaxID=43767 RepID=UPI000B3D60C9|nr:DNA cytosine methyltransferase [Prescottella equi]